MNDKIKSYINNNPIAPNISVNCYLDKKNLNYGNMHTMYDLASLTKVFCGLLILKLEEEKIVKIDDPISKYIDIDLDIKIYQLLMHTSGLKDNMIVDIGPNKIEFDFIKYNEDAINVEYADINYILLYEIIKKIGDYQNLLKKYITKDLNIVYNPSSDYEFAPTEVRKDRGLVCGQVHDSKAYKFGGVSGHAGLFANCYDLNIFFKRFLQGQIVELEKINSYKIQSGDISRNLLFETKDKRKQIGMYEGIASFHTGFTGTSILLDFKKKNFVIILTNRICPNRDNPQIFEFRKEIHNLFYELSIGGNQ